MKHNVILKRDRAILGAFEKPFLWTCREQLTHIPVITPGPLKWRCRGRFASSTIAADGHPQRLTKPFIYDTII
jgi:hypothetical protein